MRDLREGEDACRGSCEDFDVVVVGGGIAGLATAYRLRGLRVLLLEKEPRLGGRVMSDQWDVYAYNLGAQFVTGQRSAVGRFVDELGVKRVSVGREMALFFRGRVVQGGLVRIGLALPLRLSARLSLFRSGLVFAARLPQVLWILHRAGFVGNHASRDVSNTRRFVLDRTSFAETLSGFHPDVQDFYATLLSSLTAVEPNQVSTLFAIAFLFGSSDRPTLVENGMEAIVQSWQRAMTGRWLTGANVTQVVPERGGVSVTYCHSGETQTVRAARCVIATTAPEVCRLVPSLPTEQREAILGVSYGRFLVVQLFLDRRVADGIWVMPVEGKVFSTLLNPTYLRARGGTASEQGALTLYASDAWARRLWERPDGEIIERFTADLVDIYPTLRGRPVRGCVRRWPRGLPTWRSGYLEQLPLLRQPCGPIHFAGDYTGIPSLDTAVASGLRAAEEVRRTLRAHAQEAASR